MSPLVQKSLNRFLFWRGNKSDVPVEKVRLSNLKN
jgi:hypothetical protein